MNKSVVLSSVAAASVCLAALSAVANINDALVYDMALVPTDGPVTKDHVYNRLTHSAATRQTAADLSTFVGTETSIANCGTPEAMSISSEQVAVPYYTGVSNEVAVLNLPQPTVVGANDQLLYNYRQGIVFDDMLASSNATIVCRIWMDPSVLTDREGARRVDQYLFGYERVQGNDAGTNPSYGCSLFFRRNTGNDTTRMALDYGYYGVSTTGIGISDGNLGKWIDVAVVFSVVDGKSQARFHLGVKGGISSETIKLTTYLKNNQVLRFKSNKMALGGRISNVPSEDWAKIDNLAAHDAFRGKISRFRVFDRPLSDMEIRGLFTEANGGAVVIGTANGSAGEFAAEGEAAAAYDPYAMDSSKMRGTLTAEHPSLTIDCPMKGSGVGDKTYGCKCLQARAVLDGLAGGTPSLDVAVNGTKVGTLDFDASGAASLYIKGKFVQTNGNGVVRYTLTRRGNLAGSLGIDALELAGSWGEGMPRKDTKTADPTGALGTYRTATYVGHPSATDYMASVISGPKWDGTAYYQAMTSIQFYVPEDVALNRETTYTFGYRYGDHTLAGQYPFFDFYLNGVKQGESINPTAFYTPYSWTFPAGTLNPGYNSLMISNSTPKEAVTKLTSYPTIHFNYHRFSVKPPPSGMTIILR